jgi:hypothetical protein
MSRSATTNARSSAAHTRSTLLAIVYASVLRRDYRE